MTSGLPCSEQDSPQSLGVLPHDTAEFARCDRWVAFIIAAICLAPFTPLLWPDDRVIPDNIFCDYGSFQLPIREFAREEFLSGRFPLWIPYLGCGTPLHAGQQASLCHPILTPLVILLGANYGLKVSLVLELLLAFAGAYRLCRDLSISRWGASLGGMVVTWGAFPIMHLMEGHVIIVQEYALVPWFFVALNRLLCRPMPRNCAWLALAIGGMMASGQPQILYYTLLFGILWSAGFVLWPFRSAKDRAEGPSRARIIGWAAAALICGGLIGAIQLLPSLELTLDGISYCERGQASYASQHAMNATDIARLLAPNGFGNPLCALQRLDEADFVHERIGYVGVLPLLLAVYGLTRRSCARWQWGAAALILFGLAIGLGNNTPCFDILGKVLPGLTLFRCPGRILSVMTPLIALLAARGIDAWAHREPPTSIAGAWRMAVAGSLLTVLVGFALYAFRNRFDWQQYVDYARQNVAWELAGTAATMVVAAIVLGALPKRLPPALCSLAALTATMLDLGDQTIGNFSLEPRERVAVPAELPAPSEDGLPRPSQSNSHETAWEGHPPIRVADNADFQYWPGSLAGTRIVPIVIGNRLPSIITNEGGILPSSLARLHRGVERLPSVGLALSGCNYTCSRQGDVWEPLAGALPRIRLVPASKRDLVFTPIEELQPAQVEALRGASIGQVEIVHEDPQTIELQVTALDDGLLVVADLFYPGWTCTVDDQPATIEAAHGVFRAVALKQGNHRVDFHYRPTSFRLGAYWSLAGIAAIGTLLLRRPKSESPKT